MNKNGILIKDGRVIDPANRIDQIQDVLIKNGKIVEVGKKLAADGAEIIDAKGKIVAPGFIDMHTHLRQPGREDEETFYTASRTAAKGGFTSLLAMPNTNPFCDNQGVVEYIYAESKKTALVNIFAAGCITKSQQGKELTEIGSLVQSGALAITDDGKPVASTQMMRRALEYSRIFDILVIEHCQDMDLSAGGVMNYGFVSTVLGLKGMPSESESIAVQRDIQLAQLTGARLHIAHVSTKESAEHIRSAKKNKVNVTAEAMPHHFTLTEEAVRGYDTNAKVNPPLRTSRDVDAIKEALADGTIDTIATDHAPHAVSEKDIEFELASFGMIGLETALSLSIAELVDKKILTLSQLVEKLSTNPAKILKLNSKGKLSAGLDADIVIFDPQAVWVYDSTESKSKNTPFLGKKLKGKVSDLIVGGKIVLREGIFK